MIYRTTLWLVFMAFALLAGAQGNNADSLYINSDVDSEKKLVASKEKAEPCHSPRKATIMSAVVPGLGQTYNKKYWKIPIIYAGMGVSVYYLQDNLSKIKNFKQNYFYATDDDPTTVNTSGYSASDLQALVTQHKKWRDYSYLALSAVYLLQIVDANVDAHLFRFDVSDDLSLQILPSLNLTAQPTASVTFCLKL